MFALCHLIHIIDGKDAVQTNKDVMISDKGIVLICQTMPRDALLACGLLYIQPYLPHREGRLPFRHHPLGLRQATYHHRVQHIAEHNTHRQPHHPNHGSTRCIKMPLPRGARCSITAREPSSAVIVTGSSTRSSMFGSARRMSGYARSILSSGHF
jgi:hypothetical protein